MRGQNAGDSRQLLARAWLQRRAAGIEQHVRDVDDEATSRFARLENHTELLAQPFPERILFLLGLRDRSLRLFSPCAGLFGLRIRSKPGGLRGRARLLGVRLRLQRFLTRALDLEPLA